MSKREIRYAYHYNFESTGVDAVDDILDRVGAAGKAYHHTADWILNNEDYNGGKSEIEMIQEAANKSALEFEDSYEKGFEAGQKAALQWLPIETAPKEGKERDVFKRPRVLVIDKKGSFHIGYLKEYWDYIKDLRCPYCEEWQEVDHSDGQAYEGDTLHEMQCSDCEKNFCFTTMVSFDYFPQKADCLNEGEHNFREPNITRFSRWPEYVKAYRECIDCGFEEQLTRKQAEEWESKKEGSGES